jgi:mannose-6-phosphate isomerase
MGEDGRPRTLHTQEAIDVMDFSETKNAKTPYKPLLNQTTKLIGCEYFTTNLIWFDQQLEKDYISIDSFVVYICIKGSFLINYGNEEPVRVEAGETILVPAALKNVLLIPEAESKLLEVYIAENQ